jgi:hypothetical protein
MVINLTAFNVIILQYFDIPRVIPMATDVQAINIYVFFQFQNAQIITQPPAIYSIRYCTTGYAAEISFLYLNLPCICGSTDKTIPPPHTHTHTLIPSLSLV